MATGCVERDAIARLRLVPEGEDITTEQLLKCSHGSKTLR